MEKAIANAKLNELPAGVYKLCYATKQSGGDDQEDFKELAKTVLIDPEPESVPSLTVPRTVQNGHDLVIHWGSLEGTVQSKDSWIGLYDKDACTPTPRGTVTSPFDDGYKNDFESQVTNDNVEHSPHTCYKAFRFLKEGESSGTVIFAPREYRHAGTYEVRLFQGNTRNGQGIVCKGLPGSNTQTQVVCQLEAALTSSSIHIYANNDMLDDLDAVPGMEAYFDSDHGRFKKK